MSPSASPLLPVFIAVGPGRTGTTWLDAVLRPHACLPQGVKETHFFSRHYHRGIEWYASHFQRCDGAKPVGEICGYFASADATARIQRHIPKCKIIVTARDPVERVYSHYKMMRRYAFTDRGLLETIERDRNLAAGSYYGEHLPRWFDAFGRDRVFVAFYDDLRDNPQLFLDGIAKFIGIARFGLEGSPIRREAVHTFERAPLSAKLARRGRKLRNWLRDHRAQRTLDALERAGVWAVCFGGGAPYGPLAVDVEEQLRERFRADVARLESLVGRDLSSWKVGRWERAAAKSIPNEDLRSAAVRR
ncbi:MAG: sulfotransferase domain-containing protein [Candidatus Binataceae bacterium]